CNATHSTPATTSRASGGCWVCSAARSRFCLVFTLSARGVALPGNSPVTAPEFPRSARGRPGMLAAVSTPFDSGHDPARPSDTAPANSTSERFVPRWARACLRPLQGLAGRITALVALGALLFIAGGHFLHLRLVNDAVRPEIGKQLLANVTRAAD